LKQAESEMKDGMENGGVIGWHASGAKQYKGEMKNDNLNGRYTQWDEKGNITIDQDWKDGAIIKDYLAPVK
jgi:antitoxin component YwqK of YwqJK toxin-antitoxin module